MGCLTILLPIVVVWTVSVVSGAHLEPVRAAVFIGASQSDVGVNNRVNTPVRANFLPYGQNFPDGPTGRFSNGKIFPDFVAEGLGLPFPLPYNSPEAEGGAILSGINTASSGAGWLNSTNESLGVIPATQQVQWVRSWQQSLFGLLGRVSASELVRDTLYVIQIGDNDVADYFERLELRRQFSRKAYRSLMLETAEAKIQKLYSGGARNFLVTTISARGCIPLSLSTFQPTDRSKCVTKIQSFVRKLNKEYRAAIVKLEKRLVGSKFFFADTFDIVVDMFYHPTKYGLSHRESGISCCGTGTFERSFYCNSSVPLCGEPDEYLYFDSVHLSSGAVKIVVDSFIHSLKSYFYVLKEFRVIRHVLA